MVAGSLKPRSRRRPAVFRAYRRYRAEKETLQPLNEAKLLLVGNEAAGKTSLVRYLVDNLPRRDSEDPTRGTAIREKIDTKSWLADQSGGITLNVWDFGGQVIMRGTHQYFLTRRSLYLLVLDARFEDDLSIYDWLRIIRNRADDSPVIVVINKCDGDRRGPRLPEERLKKEHGVVEFIRTSCDKGEEAAATIQALRELITQTLATHDGLNQDFHFGPGTATVYTRSAPNSTSFHAEPCTSPLLVVARAGSTAHSR